MNTNPAWAVVVPIAGGKAVIDRRKIVEMHALRERAGLRVNLVDSCTVEVTAECGRQLLHACGVQDDVIREMLPTAPEPPRPANPASDGEPRVTEPPAIHYRPFGELPPGLSNLDFIDLDGNEIGGPASPPTCPVCHCPGDLEPDHEHERRHGVGELAAES